MAQNKNHITPDNFNEWLRSTGFLFPSNEVELSRFDKLYSNFQHELSGSIINPERIISGQNSSVVIQMKNTSSSNENFENFKMVARNGGVIPKHILSKMKKNQDNKKDDNGNKKETD